MKTIVLQLQINKQIDNRVEHKLLQYEHYLQCAILNIYYRRLYCGFLISVRV